MKARIEHDVLAEAVGWVARGLPTRPSVPVLAGMLVDATDGQVTLSGFDYESSGQVSVPAEVADSGRRLVSGRLLADICRSLPGESVDLQSDGAWVRVTSGSSRFVLHTLPLEEYPALPQLPAASGVVSGEALARAVSQVISAAGRDDTLPVFTAIKLEFGENAISLLATDRYRLAVREIPWEPLGEPAEADEAPPTGPATTGAGAPDAPGAGSQAGSPGAGGAGTAGPGAGGVETAGLGAGRVETAGLGAGSPGAGGAGTAAPGAGGAAGDLGTAARGAAGSAGGGPAGSGAVGAGGLARPGSVLVPAKVLGEVAKAMVRGDVTLAVGTTAGGDGLIGFQGSGRRATSRLLDGDFPKVRSLIPAESAITARITVDTAALTAAVKRVALVTERSAPIRIVFEPETATLTAGSGDNAEATETIEATLAGEPLTAGFNAEYLLGGLSALGTPLARFDFTQPTKAVNLTALRAPDESPPPGDAYILMPMRLTTT